MKRPDYKDWIREKADEIAEEKYGTDYYTLPEETQLEVYKLANEAYQDHLANQIDCICERLRYPPFS